MMDDPRPLLDISVALGPGTPEWPGDTPYSCGWTATIADGSSVNVSAIGMSPHVGTHADAAIHVRDGWPSSDALPMDAFVGPALVVDLSGAAGEIALDELAARAREAGASLDGATRLLMRTGQSIADAVFPQAWPWLAPDVVAALVAGGLRLLGVDAPSVDARESTTLPVHHALFAGGACNLENLDLRAVRAGVYELIAPPIRLVGLDAAPARALLRAASR
ncbi:MAG: cyclase family protein [Gemmatirosa sp.]|nr:cyclase family protein [Gemmatirosa sp.]